MIRRFLKEVLVFLGATLFFIGLCATVGISTSTPPAKQTAEASNEPAHPINNFIYESSSIETLDQPETGPLIY